MRQTWAVIAFLLFATVATAQPLSFNFHRVTTAQGLNISNTTAITEDKYGYIWLGTVAGLHRYDGYKMKVYEHRFGDSTSLMPSAVRYAFCDAEGRLWVSFMNGLMEYDYAHDCFKNVNMGGAGWVTNIVEGKPKHLYIGSSNGLAKLNTATRTLTWFDSLHTAGRGWPSQVWHIVPYQNDLYLATRSGIVVFNPETERYRQIDLPDELKKVYLNKIAISPNGEVWLGGMMEGDPVWRTNTRFDRWKKYTDLSRTASGQVNRANHLFFDRQSRLWASSILEGIALYDPVLDKFRSAPIEPWMPNGLLAGFIGRMYQDRKGQIWGESIKGAMYFNPDNNFFQTILPGNRADADEGLQVNHVAERPDGQLWISTQYGLYLHNPATGQHVHYVNEPGKPPMLHHNGTRPLCLDSRGDLWVGTTKGVNRLRAGSQRFEFLGEKEGLSLELAYSIAETRDGTIWVGDFSSAGHRYLPPEKNFFSLDLTALNYANPRQTWYAYKMEPYDQDWTYSRERTANYTNVPGGNYTFHYKATTDPNNWAVPEKSLRIRVGEHWYLSKWFWGLIVLLAAALGITAFRRRAQLREAFLNLERKAQALAKEKALVQYENLTQQLNPHFLFNSLASLGSLIRFDQKTASEFLEALSKMYRYILQSRDRETVSLHEETAFAEHFLKLQKTRFGEALQVRFDIDADYRERKIVPVTLQNLLENALKHNTFDTDDPLVVDVFTENNCLVVRNNKQLRSVVETSNKQGLARLQSLYQYLSNTPMAVEETEEDFTVRVPLL